MAGPVSSLVVRRILIPTDATGLAEEFDWIHRSVNRITAAVHMLIYLALQFVYNILCMVMDYTVIPDLVTSV